MPKILPRRYRRKKPDKSPTSLDVPLSQARADLATFVKTSTHAHVLINAAPTPPPSPPISALPCPCASLSGLSHPVVLTRRPIKCRFRASSQSLQTRQPMGRVPSGRNFLYWTGGRQASPLSSSNLYTGYGVLVYTLSLVALSTTTCHIQPCSQLFHICPVSRSCAWPSHTALCPFLGGSPADASVIHVARHLIIPSGSRLLAQSP